ncbi:MAG: hypothetical protein LBT37_04550 [Lactobacillaceae bacterium]|jgi:hypothetical protein|nr:hypothetical protein [Lactobacillaceae bacterium]
MFKLQLVVPNLHAEREEGYCLKFVDSALGLAEDQMSDTALIAYAIEDRAGHITDDVQPPAGLWSVGFAETGDDEGHVWFYTPDGSIEDSNGHYADYAAMNEALDNSLVNPGWSNQVDGITLWVDVPEAPVVYDVPAVPDNQEEAD